MFYNFWLIFYFAWFCVMNAAWALDTTLVDIYSRKSKPSVGPIAYNYTFERASKPKFCLTNDRVLMATSLSSGINLKVLSLNFDLLSETNKTCENGDFPSSVRIFTFECNSRGDFLLFYKLVCNTSRGNLKRSLLVDPMSSGTTIWNSTQENILNGSYLIQEPKTLSPVSNSGDSRFLLSEGGDLYRIYTNESYLKMSILRQNNGEIELFNTPEASISDISCVISREAVVYCAISSSDFITLVERKPDGAIRSQKYKAGVNGMTTEDIGSPFPISYTSLSLHTGGDILISANCHTYGGFIKISKDDLQISMNVTIAEYRNFIYPVRSLSDLSGNIYFLYRFFKQSDNVNHISLEKFSSAGDLLKRYNFESSINQAKSFYSNGLGNFIFQVGNSTNIASSVIWNTTCPLNFELNSTDDTCQSCGVNEQRLNLTHDKCEAFCGVGYGLNGTTCQKCESGSYKPSVGNSECTVCPQNSVCSSTSFTCLEGYFLDDMNCSRYADKSQAPAEPAGPAGSPSDTKTSSLNKNSVIIITGAGIFGIMCIVAIIVFRRRSNRGSRLATSPLKTRRNNLASIIGIKSSYKPVYASASQSLVSISETLAENSELSIPVFCRMILKKDFDMEERIGNGGNGVIYDCSILSEELYLRSNNQKLVFKYVGPSTELWGEQKLKSFYQELGIMWNLRTSDQFVHVAGYCEKPAGIIMKKYVGGDLSNLILAKTDIVCRFKYSKILILNLMKQISEAILFMHSSSLSHNDIKPQNVFLDVDASKTQLIAIIGDFGLCKVLDTGSMRVPAFKVADVNGASVAYAAPEAIKRIRKKIEDVNPRLLKASDTYSLSMTFMEMTVRYVPWLYEMFSKR